MAECRIMSFNAERAKVFGYKLSTISKLIEQRSKPHTHNEKQYSARYGYVSVSATLAEGANSVRFIHNNYSNQLSRWDESVIHFSDYQEDASWAKACEMADLPIDWIYDEDKYAIKTKSGKVIFKGPNAIPYDKLGQICHIIPGWQIWKPKKNKIWCTKTVAECIYAGDMDFRLWLISYVNPDELRPDQLHYMNQCYLQITNQKG